MSDEPEWVYEFKTKGTHVSYMGHEARNKPVTQTPENTTKNSKTAEASQQEKQDFAGESQENRRS